MPPPNNNASQLPFVKMMFTDNVIPDGNNVGETILWQVREQHPRAPNLRVMRMFVDRGGVEIYSASDDGKICVRDLIPTRHVRIIQEWMSLDVFGEELYAADSSGAPVGPLSEEEDDEDDDDEPDPADSDPDDEPATQNGPGAITS